MMLFCVKDVYDLISDIYTKLNMFKNIQTEKLLNNKNWNSLKP